MRKEFSRSQRVAEQIKRELAQLFQLEVADPRMLGITVTAVDVTRDFSYAKVFITLLKTEDPVAVKSAVKVLNHAAGYFRSQLAYRLKLRTVPELRFIYDESIAKGNRLAELINSTIRSDQKSNDDDTIM